MSELRMVRVCIGTPGLGIMKQEYDRLSVEDMTCWRINTAPPGMQLGIEPFGAEISGRPAMLSATVFVAHFSRDEMKKLKNRAVRHD